MLSRTIRQTSHSKVSFMMLCLSLVRERETISVMRCCLAIVIKISKIICSNSLEAMILMVDIRNFETISDCFRMIKILSKTIVAR